MIHLLQLFAGNILPIVIVAGAGYLLQRLLKLDPKPISNLTFYGLTPALLFSLLVAVELPRAEMLRMMLFASLMMTSMLAISALAGKFLRLEPRMAAALILVSTFMNAGNYGLPLNHFAFGQQGLLWASLFFVTTSLWTNSLGVFIAQAGRSPPKQALLGMVRIPSVHAIWLALLVRATGLQLPLFVTDSIALLADATIPMMLIVLGMQMGKAGLQLRGGLLGLIAALRLLVAPGIAFALASLIPLQGLGRSVGIIEAAMPSAVLTGIIAMEFDTEPDFVASAILMTTLLSPLSLTPLLGILGAS